MYSWIFSLLLFLLPLSIQAQVDFKDLQDRNGLYYARNVEGPYTGKAIKKYSDGSIIREAYFKNGLPVGTWTEYGGKYTGNTVTHFKEGKENGIKASTLPDGFVWKSETYVIGKRTGRAFTYDRFSKVLERETMWKDEKIIAQKKFKKGQLYYELESNGQATWYENEKPALKVYYSYGNALENTIVFFQGEKAYIVFDILNNSTWKAQSTSSKKKKNQHNTFVFGKDKSFKSADRYERNFPGTGGTQKMVTQKSKGTWSISENYPDIRLTIHNDAQRNFRIDTYEITDITDTTFTTNGTTYIKTSN